MQIHKLFSYENHNKANMYASTVQRIIVILLKKLFMDLPDLCFLCMSTSALRFQIIFITKIFELRKWHQKNSVSPYICDTSTVSTVATNSQVFHANMAVSSRTIMHFKYKLHQSSITFCIWSVGNHSFFCVPSKPKAILIFSHFRYHIKIRSTKNQYHVFLAILYRVYTSVASTYTTSTSRYYAH